MADKDFRVQLSVGSCWVMIQDFAGLAVQGRSIVVPPNGVHTKDYMDTLIHETAHMTLPDLSEAEIVRVAGDIAEVLWRRGYRLRK